MKEGKERRQFGGAAWAAGTMAGALVLIFGFRLAVELSPFVVETIEVKGNSYTKAEEIIASTGLVRGESLYQKDLGDVRDDVEKLPWIHRTKVTRRLPGNICIEVEEVKPSFLIRLSDRLYYLSVEGKVIDAPLAAGIDFPVVTGLDWADIEGDADLKARLVELLKNADPASFGGRIEEMHYKGDDTFVLYGNFPHLTRVIMGAGDLAEKFKNLARMNRTLEKRGQYAATADFTMDDRIIARLEVIEEKRGN